MSFGTALLEDLNLTAGYAICTGKGAKQLSFNEVPLETAAEYAAEDADVTLQLHRAQLLAPNHEDAGRLMEGLGKAQGGIGASTALSGLARRPTCRRVRTRRNRTSRLGKPPPRKIRPLAP